MTEVSRGRPSKLTPELTKEISDLLQQGNYVETVCNFVGIHKDTFYDWLRRGNRAWQADIDGGFVNFSDAVKKAVASIEIDTVKNIHKMPQNWQALAWWLERRHPDRWGNRGKQRLEIENVDVTKLTDEELRAIAEGKSTGGTGDQATSITGVKPDLV